LARIHGTKQVGSETMVVGLGAKERELKRPIPPPSRDGGTRYATKTRGGNSSYSGGKICHKRKKGFLENGGKSRGKKKDHVR